MHLFPFECPIGCLSVINVWSKVLCVVEGWEPIESWCNWIPGTSGFPSHLVGIVAWVYHLSNCCLKWSFIPPFVGHFIVLFLRPCYFLLLVLNSVHEGERTGFFTCSSCLYFWPYFLLNIIIWWNAIVFYNACYFQHFCGKCGNSFLLYLMFNFNLSLILDFRSSSI